MYKLERLIYLDKHILIISHDWNQIMLRCIRNYGFYPKNTEAKQSGFFQSGK